MHNGPFQNLLYLVPLVLSVVCLETLVAGRREGKFLNEFSVSVRSGGRAEAEELARDHGFVIQRELPHAGVFIMEHPTIRHRAKRSASNTLERLLADPRVEHAQQEEVLERAKRYVVPKKVGVTRDNVHDLVPMRKRRSALKYNDPKFSVMWYIQNNGQVGGEEGMDLNVQEVWKKGFTGKGITVTVLDDGVDHRHPDLKDNYDPKASTDLNDKNDTDHDPIPNYHNIENRHGTRCAGEIAAEANNGVCGVGIAYNCNIGGIRILDGKVTDSLESEALLFNNQHVDIYSASWGPLDNGHEMDGPRRRGTKALERGVAEGRRGLGSIFVWAAGNGGRLQDDCGADGYLGRPETLSIGSVNKWGRSPFFEERCSSTLAVVPSGGDDLGENFRKHYNNIRTITTDMNFGCVENFQGTSSAAPLAAGCIATLLQANRNLGWRDVQHIIIHSTKIPSVDKSWTINGAGHHVSPKFGFGLMDCSRMVDLAQGWTNFPDRHLCIQTNSVNKTIEQNGTVEVTMESDGCHGNSSTSVDRLEHVQVLVNMETERRGETRITLTSPSGTRSQLLGPRKLDKKKGPWKFVFMTVFSWDENPTGNWTLKVEHVPHTPGSNKADTKPFGMLLDWTLGMYGTDGTREGGRHIEPKSANLAYSPSEKEVSDIKKREFELSKRVTVKRALDA